MKQEDWERFEERRTKQYRMCIDDIHFFRENDDYCRCGKMQSVTIQLIGRTDDFDKLSGIFPVGESND